ncbi:MAG: hypothetical protein AB7T49_19475 [Oligoflexales bacterium]
MKGYNSAFFSSICVMLAIGGCRTSRQSDPETFEALNSLENLPPISCDAGEYYQTFILGKLADAPSVLSFGFPPAPSGNAYEEDPPLANFRLDVCLQDDKAKLKRVILKMARYLGYSGVLGVGTDAEVRGLDKAVFGDPRDLILKIPFGTISNAPVIESGKFHLLVKGGESDGKRLVGAAIVAGPPEQGRIYGYTIVRGEIIPGNLAFEGCPSDAPPKKTILTFSNFRMETKACDLGGSSGTSNPDIVEIVLKDDSPDAPESIRGKPLRITRNEMEQQVQVVTNHHNVCDNLIIRTSGVVYGFTASQHGHGGGTCPSPSEGAPNYPTSSSDGGIAYKFHYPSGAIAEGMTPDSCPHPIWRCEGGF